MFPSLPNKPRSDKVEYDLDLNVKEKYEVKRGVLSVKGKLKEKFSFWEEVLSANSFILSVIKEGYKIPFFETPKPVYLNNNGSANKHSNFVKIAIDDLLKSGSIVEQRSAPHCVNPLTVSVNSSGKERLILDLRHVNKSIVKQKIKFEGCKEALNYAKKGNFMIKFDLKSGYHHIDIHKEFQKFLGFSWSENGIKKYYVFTVLPFGLNCAGFLFTKVVRVLVKYWRSKSYPIIVYLDDGWCCSSLAECTKLSSLIRKDLKNAGFVVNEEKSIWKPVPKLEWLGFIWDLQIGSIEIPSRRLDKLKFNVDSILSSSQPVTARKLASVIGQIISMSFALGNVCQILTRNLHLPILDRNCWDGYLHLDQGSIDELKFWSEKYALLPFRSLSPIHRCVERIVFTDASDFAAAGVLLQSQNQIVRVMFDENEKKQSSTYRELKAVEFTLKSFNSQLRSRFVKLYTDNQNVVRIINVGSMKRELQEIALSIFQMCLSFSIFLDVSWVPRNLNVEADAYSKIFDFDDWSVHAEIFNLFNKKWGPYTCDRFADSKNFKVSKFNSQFWTPGSSGVDAFAFDWSEDNNWLVPPIHYVPNVINHMLHYKCLGTLIVPQWKSALFWPIIVNTDGDFEWYIKDYVKYVKPKSFYLPGSHIESVFAKSPFISDVLVLRIDCRS